jgi:hypothetical protein
VTEFNSRLIKTGILCLIINLLLVSNSFCQISESDSSITDFPNNLIFKPRIIFGTGFDSPVKKGDKLLDVFRAFNLRLASDEESWRNRNVSIFLELGVLYITPAADLPKKHLLPFYFRLGSEVKIRSNLLLCPYVGFAYVNNISEEIFFAELGIGVSVNYKYPLFEGVSLAFEGGTNLFPISGNYPTYTPYLGIGLSFDELLSFTAGK